MMLQALIAYAERDAFGDADLAEVDVRWQIPLDRAGRRTAGPIPLSDDPAAKKPRPRRKIRPITSPNELNQGDKSHFLCDTLERAVLLLDAKAEEKADGRRKQHGYFKRLLAEAAGACPEETPRLRAVIDFLEDEEALAALRADLAGAKAKPSDNVTFAIEGADLLDSEKLREFWRARRRKAAEAAGTRERRICLATGRVAGTLDTTDKIKGVPGGLAVGTNLISFDKDAFCSFGLEQAQNAAISPEAELKMRSALNRLIERSRQQGLVFNDTIHLHWTREAVPDDPLAVLVSGDPNAVETLIKSVRQTGREVLGVKPNAYFAMSLSGNGARIIVRDWLESTVPDVQRHIAEWFEDLAIVDRDGFAIRRGFKLGALLYAMVRAQLAELSPQVATQLFHAALGGHPLPQTALNAALRRQQLDQEDKLSPARIALIKACLLRSPTNHARNLEMKPELNAETRDRAYLCGRLFAVFGRLQYLALGSVNAGVVERYYASASVTPAIVMGRLFRNAHFHLAKAGGGAAENVRKDFETLASALGDEFPPTLDLEAQGRFALGYYHQRADYRRRSEERKTAEAAAE